MAQFDVHANEDPASRSRAPFLVDVQSDLLDELATRVVVPLLPLSAGAASPITRLMPVFEVQGARFALGVPQLAGVSRTVLGRKVSSLASRRHEIISAFDVLLSGV